ncbi:unnamed protein product [Paramecium octaurelia]|uniref:Uncharacterized protein n=1 Tax=Paramecium octaurelia TaxID=43137 RepID=A0A8S1YMF6_PAROT|nr:unnamed protein product [Paramecium octaurelia]
MILLLYLKYQTVKHTFIIVYNVCYLLNQLQNAQYTQKDTQLLTQVEIAINMIQRIQQQQLRHISLNNGWIQRIQSFMMQYLPNKYFYPKSYIKGRIVQFHGGYKQGGQSICDKFCGLSCLTNADEFYFAKCPLNYQQQPISLQAYKRLIKGECSQYTQLCQICQSRTTDEIYIAQPSYVLDDSNYIQTKKLPGIAQNQIVQISFFMNKNFYILDTLLYFGLLSMTMGSFVEQDKYNCTQYQLSKIIDTLFYEFINAIYSLSPQALQKSKIFSLHQINFELISFNTLLIRPLYSINISNFYQIEINHLFTQSSAFIIQNYNSRVDLNN